LRAGAIGDWRVAVAGAGVSMEAVTAGVFAVDSGVAFSGDIAVLDRCKDGVITVWAVGSGAADVTSSMEGDLKGAYAAPVVVVVLGVRSMPGDSVASLPFENASSTSLSTSL